MFREQGMMESLKIRCFLYRDKNNTETLHTLAPDIHEKNEFCGGDGFFGKNNWRKIWPKNGLIWPKIAKIWPKNGLKWPKIA